MLIYDGDCGFCTTVAMYAQARLRVPITVVAWQHLPDLAELGLTEADVTTAAYWVDCYGRASRGSEAAGRALTNMKGAWPLLGWFLLLPPGRALGRLAYPVIARYRYRLPGATEACAMPPRRPA